jgi:hypothetical protein
MRFTWRRRNRLSETGAPKMIGPENDDPNLKAGSPSVGSPGPGKALVVILISTTPNELGAGVRRLAIHGAAI